MGADHTAGNVVGEYLTHKLDPLKADGQVEASRNTQIAMAAIDCIGLCLLASFAMKIWHAAGPGRHTRYGYKGIESREGIQ
jgi:aldehyde:ferredoxin oxidoreductase